jgi:hypothetical protein
MAQFTQWDLGGCNCPAATGHPCGGCPSIPDTLTLSGPACELAAALTLTYSASSLVAAYGAGWWGLVPGGTPGVGPYWLMRCLGAPTLTILGTGFADCTMNVTIDSCSPFAAHAGVTIVPVGGGTSCPAIGVNCGLGTFVFNISA